MKGRILSVGLRVEPIRSRLRRARYRWLLVCADDLRPADEELIDLSLIPVLAELAVRDGPYMTVLSELYSSCKA